MKKQLLTLAAVLLWASTAQAGMFELTLGAKGGANGSTWIQPDPLTVPVAGVFHWTQTQTSYGGGGGAFVDVRLLKFLGLSIEFLGAKNSFAFTQTISGFTYEYTTSFTQFRVPLLAKLALPLGPVEFTLGVGPEFVAGLAADVVVNQDALQPYYAANAAGGTFIDGDIGINLRFGRFYIPISFRIGYNLSQSGDYGDRVALEPGPPPVPGLPLPPGVSVPKGTIEAIESINYGFSVGVGWTLFGRGGGDDDAKEEPEVDENNAPQGDEYGPAAEPQGQEAPSPESGEDW